MSHVTPGYVLHAYMRVRTCVCAYVNTYISVTCDIYLYNDTYSLILNEKFMSQILSQAVTVELSPPLDQCRLLKINSFREIELCDIANQHALSHAGGGTHLVNRVE